jgi:hypothetical protein
LVAGSSGNAAQLRWVWQAISINEELASWVYGQLVPAVASLGSFAFSVSSKPIQEHHFATDKHQTYTPEMKKIADKYGLHLDEKWNKEMLPQNGRHPNLYHDFVLANMRRAAAEAANSKDKFLELYEKYVKTIVRENPDMLNKAHWQE